MEQIVALWQQAFGDSREDILYFADNCKNKICLGYFDKGRLVSFLYLVDCVCNGKKSKYIYAACTLEAYRKRGCMSKLLDYCRREIGCFCLIPADEDLVDYYYKRGLTGRTEINNIVFEENEDIKEYLFEGCTLEKPFVMIYNGG